MSSPLRHQSPRASTPSELRRSYISRRGLDRPQSRDASQSPSQLANEFSKVFISSTQAFTKQLDFETDEQERLHREALSKSLAEHEAVRQSAERARLLLETEIERERKRREEEERIKIEDAQRKKEQDDHERRARESERQRLVEEEKLARVRQQAQAEAQRNEEVRRQAQEKLRQEKSVQEEAARLREASVKKQEEAKKQEYAKQAEMAKQKAAEVKPSPLSQPAVRPTIAISNGEIKSLEVLSSQDIITTAEQRAAEHKRYLDIHKELKIMRKLVLKEAADLKLKDELGDMRRVIQKSLSIVNAVDKTKNVKPTMDIRKTLEKAAALPMTISVKPYVVALHDAEVLPDYPAALLFLLNYFAKYSILRYTDQCGRDPKAADQYGILIAQVFANPMFSFEGHSLIDILWAKYHKVCPVLFGINGNEKTVSAKHDLGWKFETDDDASAFVPAETHYSNQTGLAAGFASITLRNFAKSANKNPAPNRLYWTALARILSTPPADRTATHCVVLRNMIVHSLPRFIEFYGGAALAVMRTAFGEWPRQAVNRDDPNVVALEGTPLLLEKEHSLHL